MKQGSLKENDKRKNLSLQNQEPEILWTYNEKKVFGKLNTLGVY